MIRIEFNLYLYEWHIVGTYIKPFTATELGELIQQFTGELSRFAQHPGRIGDEYSQVHFAYHKLTPNFGVYHLHVLLELKYNNGFCTNTVLLYFITHSILNSWYFRISHFNTRTCENVQLYFTSINDVSTRYVIL